MSRCFPFPPPGYEKKSRTERIDLLTKEKLKEKKHKKDKRDKEKREHKEKKDKDRSNDKHKDKKDRKEKNRDRKKDKEKAKLLEDGRTEGPLDVHNGLLTRESWPKDSKFMEELGRRTRHDGAADRMAGMFSIEIASQKRNGFNERSWTTNSASTSMEKERGKTHEILASNPSTPGIDKGRVDSKRLKVGDHMEKKTKAEDGVHNLNSKPLAPHKDNNNKPVFSSSSDGATKKRKELFTNGFLHENDARPEKSPRITSSSQPLSNDLKPLENNVRASSKAPHPDAKHLRKIYTVPKLEAWPEYDEQDWLFSHPAPRQKPEAPPGAEDVPRVWARAMRIDSVDGFALPYVVPF